MPCMACSIDGVFVGSFVPPWGRFDFTLLTPSRPRTVFVFLFPYTSSLTLVLPLLLLLLQFPLLRFLFVFLFCDE